MEPLNPAWEKTALKLLASTLDAVAMSDPSWAPNDQEDPDVNYTRRNLAIYKALHIALSLGMVAGFGTDIGDIMGVDYVVAYIDLPSGQVAWHVPAYPGEWDRHSTNEKYERVGVFYDAVNTAVEGPSEQIAAAPVFRDGVWGV